MDNWGLYTALNGVINVPYLWLLTLDPRVPYLSVAKSTRPSTNVRIAKMAPFWWPVRLEATMAVSHLEKQKTDGKIWYHWYPKLPYFGADGVVIRVDGIDMYVYFNSCWFVAFHEGSPLTFVWMVRESQRFGVTKHLPTLLPPCCTKGGCEFYSQLWSRHQHLGSFGCVLSG